MDLPVRVPAAGCRDHVPLALEEKVADTEAERGARDALRRCYTLQGEERTREHTAGDKVDVSNF